MHPALRPVAARLTALRPHWRALVLLAALAGLYLPWTWSGQLGSLGGDSAVYVLSAQSFAPYLPRDPVIEAVAVNSQFPPLYPLLLAATGGALDLHFAHAATTLCLIAAFAAFYAWLLRLGLPRALALAGTAVFAVLPGTQAQGLYLLSEAPYLALSLALLALLADAALDWRRYWLAAALLAAALLTRSVAVTLLPAFTLALLRFRPRGWTAVVPAAILPAALWALAHRPEHDYAAGFAEHYAGLTPGEVLGRVAAGTVTLGRALQANFTAASSAAIGAVLGLAALAGLLARLRQSRVEPAYVAVYLAMIAVWPYPSQDVRFAWVVVPILLGLAVKALAEFAQGLDGVPARWRVALPWLGVAIPALLAAPVAAAAAQRYFTAAGGHGEARHLPEWYLPDAAVARSQALLHLELAQAIRELSAEVPAGECVISVKPAVVALLGHRDGYVPPFEQAGAAALAQWLPRAPCRYFLLLALATPDHPTPYFPRAALGARLQLLDVRTSKRDESGRVVAALGRLL